MNAQESSHHLLQREMLLCICAASRRIQNREQLRPAMALAKIASCAEMPLTLSDFTE